MIHATSEALEKLRVTRRVGYFFTLWITFHAFEWVTRFVYDAIDSGLASLDIAAIIGAVLLPVTGLQTAVINFYHKDRPVPWQYKTTEAADATSTPVRD